MWWAQALPLSPDEAHSWIRYSGRPGYVKQELWKLRAWGIACGGLANMSFDLQAQLFDEEERTALDYVWVQRPVTLDRLHVVELAPSLLPTFRSWLETCRALKDKCADACFEQVVALRRAVDEERRQLGFDTASLQFEPRLLMAALVALHNSHGTFGSTPAVLKDLYEFREAGIGGSWPNENGAATESAVAARVCASADAAAECIERVWRARSSEDWLVENNADGFCVAFMLH